VHRSKTGIFKQLAIPHPLGVVYHNGKLTLANSGTHNAYPHRPIVVYGYPNQAGQVTITSKKQYLKYYSQIFTPAFRRWASIQASGLLPWNNFGPFLKNVQFNSYGMVTNIAIPPENTLNMTLKELSERRGYFTD
jgi:hypothetical protein